VASYKELPKVDPQNPDEKTRFRVWYRDADNKSRSKTFAGTKSAAERAAKKFAATVELDPWAVVTNGKQTLRSYAEEWIALQPNWSEGTAVKVESMFRLHLYPTFGNRPLGSIKRKEVQQWIAAMCNEGAAPNTVRARHEYFSAVMNAAVRDRAIGENPCKGIPLPEVDADDMVILTTEEVHSWTTHMRPRYQVAMALGAGLGLRAGEMTGLTVDRIDFAKRTVRIDRQAVRSKVHNGSFILAPLKTKASRRTIPLPQTVADHLAFHLDQHGAGEKGLVVCNERGGILRHDMLGDYLGEAMVGSGEDGVAIPDEPTFHNLRHFYAAMLIRNHLSVKVIQRRLGHKSAMVTLDTYGHLWPDDDEMTIEAVDLTLGSLLRAA
jgi:integrase